MKWQGSVPYIPLTGKTTITKMKTRILFTDLDGTLLDSYKNISDKNLYIFLFIAFPFFFTV